MIVDIKEEEKRYVTSIIRHTINGNEFDILSQT